MLPPSVKSWLNNRGISDFALNRYGIGWNGTHIVIPIRDKDGNHLYNKYRRDPDRAEGAKYLYDSGGFRTVFGLDQVKDEEAIVITEGELDAVLLTSIGIPAVSSTGGANSFNREMLRQLEGKKLTVIYDNDVAGYEGAFRIQSLVPEARLAFLNPAMKKGADVTDLYNDCGFLALQETLDSAKTYRMPHVPEGLTKTEAREVKRELEEAANMLLSIEEGKPWIVFLKEIYLKEIDALRQYINRPIRLQVDRSDDIARAKTEDPTRLVRINPKTKKAQCVWHQDKEPSMHWYEKDRRFHCFACGGHGDIIDVVMAQNGVTMKDALRLILNQGA